MPSQPELVSFFEGLLSYHFKAEADKIRQSDNVHIMAHVICPIIAVYCIGNSYECSYVGFEITCDIPVSTKCSICKWNYLSTPFFPLHFLSM